MLSNTGYGSTGPWAWFKAQGTTLEATMGLTSVTGYCDEGPAKAGQSYPDFLACWTGVLAVLAALVFREETGRGQWVDLGMYQLGATVIPEALIGWQASGQLTPRLGDRDPEAVLSGLFTTAESGRLVAVSVGTWRQVEALGALIPGMTEGLCTANDESTATLRDRFSAWTGTRHAADISAALQAVGVAAGPIMDARDLLQDPHLMRAGSTSGSTSASRPVCRPIIGRPFSWNSAGTRVGIASRAPRFGEHNEYVLTNLAGLGDEAYEQLRTRHVTTDAPLDPPAASPSPRVHGAARQPRGGHLLPADTGVDRTTRMSAHSGMGGVGCGLTQRHPRELWPVIRGGGAAQYVA